MKYSFSDSMTVKWSDVYQYDEKNVNKHAQGTAGVYLLLFSVKGSGYEPFYAGLTGDLNSRLLKHLTGSETNDKLKTTLGSCVPYFVFAEVDSLTDRQAIELYLIDHYALIDEDNPDKCNVQRPEVEPRQINLPVLS